MRNGMRTAGWQVLCGGSCFLVYFGLAVAAVVRLGRGLQVDVLVGVFAWFVAGYVVASVLCVPIIEIIWRTQWWWAGVILASVLSVVAAGYGCRLIFIGVAEFSFMELVIYWFLSLPVAMVAVVVHGRRRVPASARG